MKIYDVRVTSYIPYPITREYVIKGSNFSSVISKGVRDYRKEPRVKGKKIDRITVQATLGGAIHL